MKEHFEELIEKSKEKIEFMENLSYVTYATGENEGQAITLIDDDCNEIEISIDDIQAALRIYYKILIKEAKKTVRNWGK